jgi:hypothetical protein
VIRPNHIAAFALLGAAVICELWPAIGGYLVGSPNMSAEAGRMVSAVFFIAGAVVLGMKPRKLF